VDERLGDFHAGLAACKTAERRIREAVAGTPLEADGRSVVGSVSIGIASYPEAGRTLDSILGRADRAMYLAKQKGRNGVVKFEA